MTVPARNGLVSDADTVGVAMRDGLAEPHFDAELLERASRVPRQRGGKVGQQPRPRLDEDHARPARVDRAEIARERAARELGDGAGELDAGRAAADDDDREKPRVLLRFEVISARSNASRSRRRIAVASSSVLSPGAYRAHSSRPK
jgi:hypothetical protein